MKIPVTVFDLLTFWNNYTCPISDYVISFFWKFLLFQPTHLKKKIFYVEKSLFCSCLEANRLSDHFYCFSVNFFDVIIVDFDFLFEWSLLMFCSCRKSEHKSHFLKKRELKVNSLSSNDSDCLLDFWNILVNCFSLLISFKKITWKGCFQAQWALRIGVLFDDMLAL